MSSLAQLLAAGTASFNAARARGEIPLDQSASTLSGLFFARADLSQLDLSNAELEDCTAGDVDFRGADLRGAYLHGGRYERCDFRGAKFEGATLEHVEFVECDFTGATGLGAVELEEVMGFAGAVTGPPEDLEEVARFVPGLVAINPELEAALEAHPGDEERWLVYADWLLAEGDLRGELITRQHAGADFQAFVEEHLDQLFPGCADEVRGGGQVPELALEWRHGFVVGATLAALNRERAVNLGDLAQRLLPLPVCRFIRRLSFGLNHEVTPYGERLNDYAPVVAALAGQPRLARLHQLEFGVQEPELDEDSGEPEPLHAFGDLSALWPQVPQLRQLRVKGADGVLGALNLPELREASFQLERLDEELFNELIAARWPKLERFELWDRDGTVELEPLLHVLSATPLRELALPYTDQARVLLEQLLRLPLLRQLRVIDLHEAALDPAAVELLNKHVAAFRHLEQLRLTSAGRTTEENALGKLGNFVVLNAPEDSAPRYGDELDWEDESEELTEDPAAPGADLDIPDEHGD